MTELYRLKLAKKSGGASWGDHKYYEGKDAFDRALFEALLSEAAHKKAWPGSLTDRLISIYYRATRQDERTHTDRVIAAEKLVDGEWVPVNARIIPPRLEYF